MSEHIAFEVFEGPRGTKFELWGEGELELGIVTDYGYGFSIPLEDFKAFAEYWNYCFSQVHIESGPESGEES